MRKRDRSRMRVMLTASEILSVLVFVLIMLIPLADIDGTSSQRIVAFALAAAFWICIVAIIILSHLCGKIRRKHEAHGYSDRNFAIMPIGVFSFFSSRTAATADTVFILSIIWVAIVILTRTKNRWLVSAGIGFLLVSFIFHCLLNGRNYRFMKNINDEEERTQDE